VIVAGGGRDLAWPHQRIAAELLARSGGRLVHLLLHGGARGADAAISRAAQQLGWSSLVMPAEWGLHGRAAGPIRNRELLEQAVARAVANSSPGHQVSVLVMAFPGAVAYGKAFPEFWVQTPFDGGKPETANGLHIAFVAPDKAAVDAFYAVAMELGARDDGKPGPRPQYSDAYYAAFVRDLDGHKIEALWWDETKAQPTD